MVKYSVLRIDNLKVASNHSIKLEERTLSSLKKPARPDKLMYQQSRVCLGPSKNHNKVTLSQRRWGNGSTLGQHWSISSFPILSNQSIDQPASQSVLSGTHCCCKASRERALKTKVTSPCFQLAMTGNKVSGCLWRGSRD